MPKKNKKKAETSERSLKKKLLSFIEDSSYSPSSQKKLFELCLLTKKEAAAGKKAITELLTEEKIFIKSGLIHSSQEKKEEIVNGKIHLHPKGFGFVSCEDTEKYPKDIFIPKHQTLHATHQDKVSVKILPSSKKDKGPEGMVVAILERGSDQLVATIYEASKTHVIAFCPGLTENKEIHLKPCKKLPLNVGDRVLLSVKSWDDYPEKLDAEVTKILGHVTDASQDVDIAAIEYKIPRDFPAAVIKEAKKFPKNPTKQDTKHRLDLTSTETFTIDPDTAKDFDDALSLSKDADGDYHLIVHIADVSHYVAKDSELDKEAIKRCNSTYFPGQCIPMLPEELSNGLCSLKEDVPRLTISVFMHFSKSGELKNYDIRKTYIQSQKRFTYKQAKLVLDKTLESPHYPTLCLMKELAQILQKRRHQRGSVDLAMPEVVLILNDKQEPEGFEVIEYDITHQLVEEFMLKANEIVAHALIARNTMAIFRTHESPGASEMADFFQLARGYGLKIKKNMEQFDVQQLFKEAKETPYLYPLSVAFIRSMKMAIYSEENIGHFGLGLEHYCHFTSPIRRYSDLIIHRLLFEEEIPKEELKKISLECSERERHSFRAEQSVISLKKLRYLHSLEEKKPEEIYPAMISKVKPFGIYFEITSLHFEGFIHISEIADEYLIYDDKAQTLVGEKTRMQLKVGSEIAVQILHLNLITQELLWKLVREEAKKKRKRKK